MDEGGQLTKPENEAGNSALLAEQKLPTSLVFVDGTHVDHRCQEAFGRKDIDFKKFFLKLTLDTRLLEVVYCTAPYLFEDLRKHQKGVMNRLHQIGVKLTVYEGRHMRREWYCKSCDYRHVEPVEKGTDVAVAAHLVRAACGKLADRLILVSGDNDFWPALEIAKSVGGHCEFAYFVGPKDNDTKVFNEVSQLRYNSRKFHKLNQEFMKDCWFNNSSR